MFNYNVLAMLIMFSPNLALQPLFDQLTVQNRTKCEALATKKFALQAL